MLDPACDMEEMELGGADLEDPESCPQPQELLAWPPAREGCGSGQTDLLGIERNSLVDM